MLLFAADFKDVVKNLVYDTRSGQLLSDLLQLPVLYRRWHSYIYR